MTAERGGGGGGGRYLFVMDKRAAERGKFQSSLVDGISGGAGGPREECTCDEEGRLEWSVGCKRRAADAAAFEQAVTFCLYLPRILWLV